MTTDNHDLTVADRTAMLAAFLDKHQIKVSFTFVPFSASRNAGEKSPSLNWKAKIRKLDRPGLDLVVDYSQGCGHAPSYKVRQTLDGAMALDLECETGKRWGNFSPLGPIPPPPELDLFYSLAMEAEVLDQPDFESWAEGLGYDLDSRKAEAIYRDCMQQARKLRIMISDAGMEGLRRIVKGY